MLPEPPADRAFNNADSFAQAFDEAWSRLSRGAAPAAADTAAALLEAVLEQLRDHPFAAADPAMARQVGEFRIRLLGL
ncbi:MAG: hypothetical protein ACKOZT_03050 [Cyanobium sp.]